MDYRITSRQLAMLNSFRCVRLSDEESLLRWVDTFHNPKNDNLVDYLKGDAFEDDAVGRVACYVVLDLDNEIICFFTIKAGVLYSEFEELKLYERHKKLKIQLSELIEDKKNKVTDELMNEVLDQLNESKEQLIKKLGDIDQLPKHKHVAKSYSAIELSHFCVNEYYKGKWKDYDLGERNKIGATVFWHFIVAKILEISNLLGCEYFYLFAADGTSDQRLVNHYMTFMNFRDDYDVLAIQPIYDFRCTFLCNTINEVRKGRDRFYDLFNEPVESV